MNEFERLQERAETERQRAETERKIREDKLLVAIRGIVRSLDRYEKIPDPVLRFSLILDKFIMASRRAWG